MGGEVKQNKSGSATDKFHGFLHEKRVRTAPKYFKIARFVAKRLLDSEDKNKLALRSGAAYQENANSKTS